MQLTEDKALLWLIPPLFSRQEDLMDTLISSPNKAAPNGQHDSTPTVLSHPPTSKRSRHGRTNGDARASDCWIYRMVVGALGLVMIISVVGAIILGMAGKPTPDGLLALGSAAVGALAGLLVPAPHR